MLEAATVRGPQWVPKELLGAGNLHSIPQACNPVCNPRASCELGLGSPLTSLLKD